jgi:hypothetical protein
MDPVEILFKEYDTLRSEAIARRSEGFQFAAIGGAGLAWFAAQPHHSKKLWTLLAILAFGYCLTIYCAIRDLKFLSLRIAEIEQEVNRLSDAPGLLKWETHWGWPSFRWGGLIRRRPRY